MSIACVFKVGLGQVLKWEGGLSNDPADRGGLTNYGITHSTARRNGIDDVRKITQEQVRNIYYKDYWLPSYSDKFSNLGLAIAHFDTAVNMGLGGAKRVLITALNNCGVNASKELSIEKLVRMSNLVDSKKLQNAYLQARIQRYNSIIANNPSQEKFRRGWMNRMKDLAKVVGGDLSSLSASKITYLENDDTSTIKWPKFSPLFALDIGAIFFILGNDRKVFDFKTSWQREIENQRRENEEYYIITPKLEGTSQSYKTLNQKDKFIDQSASQIRRDLINSNSSSKRAKKVTTEEEILEELDRARKRSKSK